MRGKELLGLRKWIKISLKFNSTSKEITLRVNDKIFSSFENEFNYTIIPEIFFGKHGSIIDVPSMAIKELVITNKKNKTIFLFASSVYSQKFVYEKGPLELKANSLADGLGQFVTDDLLDVNPKCTIKLKKDATPLTQKMWAIALNDVELNLITNELRPWPWAYGPSRSMSFKLFHI